MVCVNKADLNADATSDIQRFSEGKGYAFLGTIPFDPAFTKAMVAGKTVLEYDNHCEAAEAVRKIWQGLAGSMEFHEGR
jgi:MinD superfamily P-loop ATPase